MTHTVQFTTIHDFIHDLDSGLTAAVYHQLIEQRTATSDYGLTRWQLTTIIRAIVANGPIIHVAAITIPHGPQVQRVNGRTLGPPIGHPSADGPDRWNEAHQQHDAIIDELRNRLRNRRVDVSLLKGIRPGILNVPNDLPLVYAANPLEEEAPAPPD